MSVQAARIGVGSGEVTGGLEQPSLPIEGQGLVLAPGGNGGVCRTAHLGLPHEVRGKSNKERGVGKAGGFQVDERWLEGNRAHRGTVHRCGRMIRRMLVGW